MISARRGALRNMGTHATTAATSVSRASGAGLACCAPTAEVMEVKCVQSLEGVCPLAASASGSGRCYASRRSGTNAVVVVHVMTVVDSHALLFGVGQNGFVNGAVISARSVHARTAASPSASTCGVGLAS